MPISTTPAAITSHAAMGRSRGAALVGCSALVRGRHVLVVRTVAVTVMPPPVAARVCTHVLQFAANVAVVLATPFASVLVAGGLNVGAQGSSMPEKVTSIPASPLPLQSLKVAVNVVDPPGSTTGGFADAVEVLLHPT